MRGPSAPVPSSPDPSWRGLIIKISLVAAVVVTTVIAQVAYDLWRSHDRQILDAERNAANLVRLLDEHAAGRADHGKRLWSLLNLEAWCQRIRRP